jgi:hypothetical protein
MKKGLILLLLIICVLMVAGPVSAASFGYPNGLVNGGFETGDLTGWISHGSSDVYSSGDWSVNAAEGDNYAGGVHNNEFFGGGIVQFMTDMDQQPGWDPNGTQMLIDLEFLALLHDGYNNNGLANSVVLGNTWMEVIIAWLDTQSMFHWEQVFLESNQSLLANTLQWKPVHIEYLIGDCQPNEAIIVWFHWWKIAPTPQTYAFVDAIDFESQCIPEPATAGLFLLGLTALLTRRRAGPSE